ncbi:hypothetical protein EASAB2608_06990 [Streptomyces sp. EAS-AB2608]|nr:hypothetical protein EASAB2608_06990 [Streptomyces sp. EAS-AB2608]
MSPPSPSPSLSPSPTGPRSAPADATALRPPLPSARPAARGAARAVRLALCLAPLLLAAGWAVANRPVVEEGVRRLLAADPRWLPAAVGFTCLTWVAAACVRQGALPDPLPPGLLLASQFAAGAANHVLPGGLGAHAVTLRFLRGRGVPLDRATASSGCTRWPGVRRRRWSCWCSWPCRRPGGAWASWSRTGGCWFRSPSSGAGRPWRRGRC